MIKFQFTEESVAQHGATIRYLKTGSGPGLLIIHGAMRTAEDYLDLAEHLADYFTVYIVNRRGRGGSSQQGAAFSVQQECDDTLAILRRTNTKLCFGHSYGGVVALEVALSNYPLAKLAVYEPPFVAKRSEMLKELDLVLAQKDYKKALVIAFSLASNDGTTPDQLTGLADAIAQGPMWNQMVELLPTFATELRSLMYTASPLEQYKAIQTETLLMHGDQSLPATLEYTKKLANTLPHSQSVAIVGVGHNAPDLDAPESVAKELIRFFMQT